MPRKSWLPKFPKMAEPVCRRMLPRQPPKLKVQPAAAALSLVVKIKYIITLFSLLALRLYFFLDLFL